MNEYKRENFYILTGAPGVGKSTLLSALKQSYSTVSEPAREVISRQRSTSGNGLWHQDRNLFVRLLLEKSIEKYDQGDLNELTFFDRGIPDNTAYASYGELEIKPFREATRKYRYNQKAFILSPWEDIYTTDEERNMTFKEVINFHEHILDAYRDYDLIEVPKGDLIERVKFIEQHIK